MIKPRILPECRQCQFYGQSQYLVCAVHPMGYQGDSCLDFRPDPHVKDEEVWVPEGCAFYNDELIPIATSPLTQEDRELLLEMHPFFVDTPPERTPRSKQRPGLFRRAIAFFKRIIRSLVRFLQQ